MTFKVLRTRVTRWAIVETTDGEFKVLDDGRVFRFVDYGDESDGWWTEVYDWDMDSERFAAIRCAGLERLG